MKAPASPAWKNQLYFGDNLAVLREHVPDESVDLVYLDPPFNSNATYNVLFKEHSGERSGAQITAFDDTWQWGLEAEATYRDTVERGGKLADLLPAFRAFLGQSDMMAYLTMMAPRLQELHRVLKPTGSLYLHCDPTASHYLKLLLDAIFGPTNFKNEVIWKRTSAHSGAARWGDVHDTILFYGKGEAVIWNEQLQAHDARHVESKYSTADDHGPFMPADLTGAGHRDGDSGKPWRGFDPDALGRHWAVPRSVPPNRVDLHGWADLSTQEKLDRLDSAGMIYWPKKADGFPRFKRYLVEGRPIQSVIVDIPPINSQAQERLGYPTQKPEALLERIIRASSNEHDVVLDPFCGCGTAIAVAERLHRRWIGIDVTHLAVSLIKRRLNESFGKELAPYETIGEPKDLAGARALAEQDRFEFQKWALGLVDASAREDSRKGADAGADGRIYFFDDKSGVAKKIILQVKSGGVQARDIRDLKAVIARDKAAIGVFITLDPPSRPMQKEALAAGFYAPEQGRLKFPIIQILTIQDLLDGKRVARPLGGPESTFKVPERKSKKRTPEKLF